MKLHMSKPQRTCISQVRFRSFSFGYLKELQFELMKLTTDCLY